MGVIDTTEEAISPGRLPSEPEPVPDAGASSDGRAGAQVPTHRPLIIMPAWNEEAPLPGVLTSLRDLAPTCDVLVVSDGSTDRTAAVARAGGARVVELPYNLGIGGALRAGFRFAVREGYRNAVQFDADGQHDPTQIDLLLEALDAGADLAIGSRFASDAGYEVGKVRGLAMRLLRFTVRRLTGIRFTDTSSGFRGFSEPMLDFFATTYPSEYMESVEALLLAHRNGFHVVEVPVRMQERQDGTASNRNLKLLYHYLRLLLTIAAGAKGHRRTRTARQEAQQAPAPAPPTSMRPADAP